MKKLLSFLFTILIAHSTLVPMQEKAPRKGNILTSKPAKILYGIGGAIGTIIGYVYLKAPILSRIQYEKAWRAGRDIAQAIERERIDEIIEKYFNFDATFTKDDVDYACSDIASDRKLLFINPEILGKCLADIKKETEAEELHLSNMTEEEEDRAEQMTQGFKELKKYSDAMHEIYENMCTYNKYLMSQNKKIWDIAFMGPTEGIEAIKDPVIKDRNIEFAVYVNPPVNS